jgi:hypothetical protein
VLLHQGHLDQQQLNKTDGANAIRVAEAGVSLNRLASLKLSQ